MSRSQECPRCGAGVRHNDAQCWRCGEALRASKPVQRTTVREAVGIRDVADVRPTPKPKVQTSGLQSLTEVQGGRYKELQDREKELREAMDSLEEESKELDKVAQQLQEEAAALDDRERRLKAREDELDALAFALQPALQAAEDYHRGVRAGDAGAAQINRIFMANRDLHPILEKERARIRGDLERQMADQLSRIAQLEDELRVACAHSRPSTEVSNSPELNIAEVIQRISEEVRGQLGAGLAVGGDDRRFLTHIERLDSILAGGIPAESVVLLNGPAGSMKTTLAYHILHSSAARSGIKGMYFSLEQDRDALIRQMSRLGMERERSLDHLKVVDLVELRRSMEGQRGDWRAILMSYVAQAMEREPFQLFVLDSMESFMAMSEHEFSRAEVQDLFDWFRSLGLTTLVISETPLRKLEDSDRMELYVADGAIELAMKEVGDSHVQRWLRCVKLRGANIDPRYYCLLHECGAFSLSIPMMRCHSESSEP